MAARSQRVALATLLGLLHCAGCRSNAEPTDAGPDLGEDGPLALQDRSPLLDYRTPGERPPPACDPLAPRTPPPELLIGPLGLEAALLSHMGAATRKLQVMMYQLTVPSFVDAMIAAHQGGVAVQVLLDAKQGVNATARSRLEVAGVPVKAAPPEFDHAHAKVILVDDSSAVVMSANMNDYSISSERNYGVIDRDPADLASLSRVFERDWAGSGPIDLSCTRLLVSPLNARQRLAAFISGAISSLDLAVMYVTDSELQAAVISRATAGVKVRVLLADPAWISSNTQTAKVLAAEGIPVRFLKTVELHAKLVLADGAAFVGSQNLSYNSLQNNREVGLLITEPQPAAAIAARFEADWQAGVAPP